MVKTRAEITAHGTCRRTSAAGLTGWLLMVSLLPALTGCLRKGALRAPDPAAPNTLSCTVSPSTAIHAGDLIQVTGIAGNFHTSQRLSLLWKTDGGKIVGPLESERPVGASGSTPLIVTIDTEGLAPGNYQVIGDARTFAAMASCSAGFTVAAPEPLSVSCSAAPWVARPGDTVTITASATSSKSLTYSYSSTDGTVTSSGATAMLSLVGAPPGTITVTCSAGDNTGRVASSTTSVSLLAFSPRPVPVMSEPTRMLPECIALPAHVRSGSPVQLRVLAPMPDMRAVWTVPGANVVDPGMTSAVVDTGGMLAGLYVARAMVPELGECETRFQVNDAGAPSSWGRIDMVRYALLPDVPEGEGFRVYTYVLARRAPDAGDYAWKQRFRKVLEAVSQRTDVPIEALLDRSRAPNRKNAAAVARQVQAANDARRRLGPVIVPVKSATDFSLQSLIEQYDTDRSLSLLQHVNCAGADNRQSCERLLRHDGPFLVTTTVRLSGQPRSVLLQDLSSVSPEVGGDWVVEFAKMVSEERSWTSVHTSTKFRLSTAAWFDRAGQALQKSSASVKAVTAMIQNGK